MFSEKQTTVSLFIAAVHGQLEAQQEHTQFAVLREDASICDVTFKIGRNKKEFHAVKALFAMKSEPFKKLLFIEQESKSDKTIISLPDITENAFTFLRDYFYGLKATLSCEHIGDLLYAVIKYAPNPLEKICTDYINNIKDISQLISVISSLYKHKHLLSKVTEQIVSHNNLLTENAKKVILSDNFKLLPQDLLIEILKFDEIYIKEEEIYQRCVVWCKYQAQSHDDNRNSEDEKFDEKRDWKTYIKPLLIYIRFPVIDGKYFAKNIFHEKILTDQDMLNLMAYYLDQDQEIKKFNTQFRWPLYKPPLLQITNITPNTVNIIMKSASESNGDSVFKLKYRQDYDEEKKDEDWIEIEIKDNKYDISDLQNSTRYVLSAKCKCGNNDWSDYSKQIQFLTPAWLFRFDTYHPENEQYVKEQGRVLRTSGNNTPFGINLGFKTGVYELKIKLHSGNSCGGLGIATDVEICKQKTLWIIGGNTAKFSSYSFIMAQSTKIMLKMNMVMDLLRARWQNGDTFSVILDCDQWKLKFVVNGQDSVECDIESNETYYFVISTRETSHWEILD